MIIKNPIEEAKNENIQVGMVHPDLFNESHADLIDGKIDNEELDNYGMLVVSYIDYIVLKRKLKRLQKRLKR